MKENERKLVDLFLNNNKHKYINAIFFSDHYFIGNKYICHSNIIRKFINKISDDKYILFYYPDMILSKNFIINIKKFKI